MDDRSRFYKTSDDLPHSGLGAISDSTCEDAPLGCQLNTANDPNALHTVPMMVLHLVKLGFIEISDDRVTFVIVVTSKDKKLVDRFLRCQPIA